jgi:polyribonucleotide nucleotidyltransferase
MNFEGKKFSTVVGDKTVTIETGRLAGQAGGAVTIGIEDSIVFAAATMGGVREGIDFFPLSVEYEERLYAGGKIPGSFFRREGRASTESILTARLTDRPLRPLFQDGMRNEVQVIMYSFSADGINPLDILAINAASTAIMISDIPWGGPVGAVRIGRVNGEFVVNPTFAEIEASDLDLRLAGTKDAILMVECGANEIPEDVMAQALDLGHASIQPLVDLQLKIAAEIGKPKREVKLYLPSEEAKKKVFDRVSGAMNELLDKPLSKVEFYSGMSKIKEEAEAELCSVPDPTNAGTSGGDASAYLTIASFRESFELAEMAIVRERILSMGKRPDGRTPTEIRPIWCDVGLSPRAHGTGLFTRGETQILSFATLATLGEAQELDNLSPINKKRYMHHYNFPPFSTGEAKMLRGQSRREVGHGALAERALEPVIPAEESFPYAIRVVSEALSSNGSTSMGSVCGSTLALMDAGVPIKAPVSGVAMGLITDPSTGSGQAGRYQILTDIQGTEDHLGDMDFKVAGTAAGITALQMDIKISGLSAKMMKEALAQAYTARMSIMEKMLAVLAEPRAELKPHAPRIITVKIPIDKIGALIGPGGKNIRALQEETGVKIDIEEDGTVYIASTSAEGAKIARERIEGLSESAVVGNIYTGKVVRIEAFGAFVNIMPGIDGLVHISQLASERVNTVEDVCVLGDELTVMVTDIDPAGKIRLSRQAVLEGWSAEEAREKDKGGRSGGGGSRGGDRGGRGGPRNGGGGDRGRSGGGDRNRR